MHNLTIAAVQNIWASGNTKYNLNKMLTRIKEISSTFTDVDIICFPETALQGYDVKNWKKLAEPIPGPSTLQLCKMASEVNKWIVLGLVEKKGEAIYNSCIFISSKGEIAHKYRKNHPWMTFEPITPGNKYEIYIHPKFGKLGFMICYDGFFPETARSLIWNGAEIIIWPSFIFHPHEDMFRTIAKARAIENQCFIVGINGCGIHGGGSLVGHSLFVDPTGNVLSEAGDGEAILIETLDLDMVKTIRKIGAKRGNTILKHWKEMRKKYEIYSRDTSHAKF